MVLKNDVKQRRQQKIKSLIEKAEVTKPEIDTTTVLVDEPRSLPEQYDKNWQYDRPVSVAHQDPELAWKTNPNPWAAWGDSFGGGDKRSFVPNVDLTNNDRYGGARKRHSFRKELLWKLIISTFLFVAIWTMFQINESWTLKGQAVVKQALTDEIDFAVVAAWYKNNFAGAPSFIPIFGNQADKAIGVDGKIKQTVMAPLSDGSLVRTFAELLNGIELAGASEAEVVAADTGRVILVTGNPVSIMLQHANERITVYGGLGVGAVKVNDWVEAGDTIGHLAKSDEGAHSLLYFAVKEKDMYLDPMDVIAID